MRLLRCVMCLNIFYKLSMLISTNRIVVHILYMIQQCADKTSIWTNETQMCSFCVWINYTGKTISSENLRGLLSLSQKLCVYGVNILVCNRGKGMIVVNGDFNIMEFTITLILISVLTQLRRYIRVFRPICFDRLKKYLFFFFCNIIKTQKFG